MIFMPCISLYLDDDITVLPQHLTCARDFEEVLGLSEIPCISLYLDDDITMLPQHLNCVRDFEDLLGLSESQSSQG